MFCNLAINQFKATMDTTKNVKNQFNFYKWNFNQCDAYLNIINLSCLLSKIYIFY